MNNSSVLARVFGWLGLAVAAALVVLFFVFLQGGSCTDAAPGHGDSVCTSGPVVGVAGAWGIAMIGAIVIVFSITRAILVGRRRKHTER